MVKRKGQTVGVDFAIAMSIFIITVVTGIFYTVNISIPSSPFSEQVRSSTLEAGKSFYAMTSWEQSKYSVETSDVFGVENYPIEIDFWTNYPLENFSRILENGENISADFYDDLNQTVFLADLSNNYEMIYTEDKNLGEQEFEEKIFSDDDKDVWNDVGLEASVGDDGIESYNLSEDALINDMDLGGDGEPNLVSGELREYFEYGDLSLRFFGGSSIVKVHGNDFADINFSDSYEEAFFGNNTGETEHVDFLEGESFSGHADFFNLTGQAENFYFLSESMEINAYESGNSIMVEITSGSDDSLFYAGDSQEFEGVRNAFFEPSFEKLSVSRKSSTLSDTMIKELEDMEYESFGQTLGIVEMGYNITVEDVFSKGGSIPSGQDVFILEYPVTITDSSGNRTMKFFRLGVWN